MTLATINDLNKLSSDEKLIVLLEVEIPANDTLYLARFNNDVTFNTHTYQKFWFEFGDITTGKGEVPSFELRIDNTSRSINALMINYDIYLKTNGIEGNKIFANVIVVNTVDLSDYVNKWRFELTSWDIDSNWASFKLGAENPFNKNYPMRQIFSDFCSWKFKDSRCGYTGGITTCDKTLKRCREIGNQVRYGGFYGVRS